MQFVLTIVGFAGALAVLGSFAATAAGRLTPSSGVYHGLNLGGGLSLLASGAASGAWPSVVTNGVWAVISLAGLAALLRTRARTRTARVTFDPPTAELCLPTAELALPR